MYPLLPTLVFLALLSAPALAQEPPPPPNLEPIPDGSPVPGDTTEPQLGQEEELQPEVTIRRREGGEIEEYRINGRLYMVRVVPTKGFPYYLIDMDGDGNLETRRNDLDPNVVVPNWVLFSW